MSLITIIILMTALGAAFRMQAVDAVFDALLSGSDKAAATEGISVEEIPFDEEVTLAGEYIPAATAELEHIEPQLGPVDQRQLTHWL